MTATPPQPDADLIAWAVAALDRDPGAGDVECEGLREGGSPWRLRLADGSTVVLRELPASARAQLATEVAALELAGSCGLPVPRVVSSDLEGTVCEGRLAVLTTLVAGSSRVSGPPPLARFRALGALAARLHAVPPPPPSAELPVRERPLAGVDFAALRQAAPPRPLLVAAEDTLGEVPVPERTPVFVHGDLWQGNTLWAAQGDGAGLTGIVDWDCAGVGPAGIDLGSLRCDAALSAGLHAADAVLTGYEEAADRPADDVAYWDVVAGLCTPPTIDWFADAIRDQGRTDLTQPTLLTRRDAFLRDALHRLG